MHALRDGWGGPAPAENCEARRHWERLRIAIFHACLACCSAHGSVFMMMITCYAVLGHLSIGFAPGPTWSAASDERGSIPFQQSFPIRPEDLRSTDRSNPVKFRRTAVSAQAIELRR